MVMNNPLRALIQEKYELRILRNMSSIHAIGQSLEIGCGNGNGTRLIKKYFSPNNITAIDLDDKMIAIAKSRNKDTSIVFRVMDASKLEFPDNQFDAIFDFGIIHHIPNWKECIRELRRVLKPGGKIIIEDLSRETFTKGIGRLWRILSDHPYESMYTAGEFNDYLMESGFKILNYKQSNPFRLIRFFSLNGIKTVFGK